jgi:hypothetical protein
LQHPCPFLSLLSTRLRRTHLWRRSSPCPSCRARCGAFDEPINPSGILVQIVGTQKSFQGRSCEEHEICDEVLKEDVVVRLRKMQLLVEGKEETVITARMGSITATLALSLATW